MEPRSLERVGRPEQGPVRTTIPMLQFAPLRTLIGPHLSSSLSIPPTFPSPGHCLGSSLVVPGIALGVWMKPGASLRATAELGLWNFPCSFPSLAHSVSPSWSLQKVLGSQGRPDTNSSQIFF